MPDNKTGKYQRKFQVEKVGQAKDILAQLIRENAKTKRAEILDAKVMNEFVRVIGSLDNTNEQNRKIIYTLINRVNELFGRMAQKVDKMGSEKPVVNVKVDAPAITVPEIKIPEIRIPEIKLPEYAEREYEPASKWNFMVNRHDNGLIKSVTAERVD